MKRGVWVAIFTALVSALTTWPALASPAVTGIWDVTATAVARYRYEGRPVRLEVPFSFALTFDDDGTYRAADISISCLPEGVTLPEVQGTWRLGRGGRVRANPSLISALREGTESCLAGTRASVLASRARVAVAGEGDRLDGAYNAVLSVRYREGDELEHVRVRVVVTLVGTRRAG
jgi:hypothetical protein